MHLVMVLEHKVSAAYMVMDFVEALFIKSQQRKLKRTKQYSKIVTPVLKT